MYSEDVNGNNPLELACIRGYLHYADQAPSDGPTYRYKVLELLLDPEINMEENVGGIKRKRFFDLSDKTLLARRKRNRGNSPLHWAAYFNDKDSFGLLFQENPS